MKKPTLEEVREYFKDAKVVRNQYSPAEFNPNLQSLHTDYESHIYTTMKDNVCQNYTLWCPEYGYAEIIEYKSKQKTMKKVIRLDEPKEEKQPKPIELTHVQEDNGWKERKFDVGRFDKIVYLGFCSIDGDLFSGYLGCRIVIFKGHLNDGVY